MTTSAPWAPGLSRRTAASGSVATMARTPAAWAASMSAVRDRTAPGEPGYERGMGDGPPPAEGGGERGRRRDDDLDLEGPGPRPEDADRLGMGVGVDEDEVAVGDRGDAVGEADGLGHGGVPVGGRGVGGVHPRDG